MLTGIKCCLMSAVHLLSHFLVQALCAEASLAALRRVYPQIYASDVKLLIDPSAVTVTRQDFLTAMKGEQQRTMLSGNSW
jgi:SpoVK/Ycf46/Vps4 family AAA+-type ATPase